MALTRKDVLAQRSDISQYLFHFTKSNPVLVKKQIHPSIGKDTWLKRTAKERLEVILKNKLIKAISAFGYFQYKVPQKYSSGYTHNQHSQIKIEWLKAACFTETPLDFIPVIVQPIAGRAVKLEPFGLAFKESFIRKNGGNPLFYSESENKMQNQALDSMGFSANAPSFKVLFPLYENFGKSQYRPNNEIDFRWEREWRTINDLTFNYSDIAFVICPSNEHAFFSQIIGPSVPLIDIAANMSQNKNYLRGFSHLADLK